MRFFLPEKKSHTRVEGDFVGAVYDEDFFVGVGGDPLVDYLLGVVSGLEVDGVELGVGNLGVDVEAGEFFYEGCEFVGFVAEEGVFLFYDIFYVVEGGGQSVVEVWEGFWFADTFGTCGDEEDLTALPDGVSCEFEGPLAYVEVDVVRCTAW